MSKDIKMLLVSIIFLITSIVYCCCIDCINSRNQCICAMTTDGGSKAQITQGLIDALGISGELDGVFSIMTVTCEHDKRIVFKVFHDEGYYVGTEI